MAKKKTTENDIQAQDTVETVPVRETTKTTKMATAETTAVGAATENETAGENPAVAVAETKATKSEEANADKPKQKEENVFERKAHSLFADYRDTEVFYFTSDGLAFFSMTDAKNHATSLGNKEIKTIKKK
jgi:hypothetical protein